LQGTSGKIYDLLPEDDETEVLHIAHIKSEKSEEMNKDILSTNEKNKKKKKKKKSSELKIKKKRKRKQCNRRRKNKDNIQTGKKELKK